jgi:hypothetical protein
MLTDCLHPGRAAGHSSLTPPVLAGWLSPFRACFSAAVWARILVLVAGTVLAPGKRTVSQALRVTGLETNPGFSRYYEVLNRGRWDGRAVARTLLMQVLSAFLPTGEVVLGVDDTIERRWASRSRRAGFTEIRCAPHAATLFEPAACAGCRSWSWCRPLGPAGAGPYRC